MAEQSLDGGQVGAGLEQVGGEAVPQGVDGGRLPQPGVQACLLEGSLQSGHVEWLAGRAGE